uniref:La n=1 Tax=Lygus hesperus TaxID=30085 RepID=A0A0A9Z105_LYGHE
MVEEKSEVEVSETDGKVEETKSTPASNITDQEARIIKQIEYYFGDINLPRDKFLLEQVKVDDGWIELETMIKFKRLAQITTDFGEICSALKKSDSGLIEVNDDNTKIRRSPHVPLPEMNEGRRKEIMARSAYVRRFPVDYKIDDLLSWCSTNAPDYENVVMRNYHDKAENKWCFKGSVYVTFKTQEACQKFIEGEAIELNGEKLDKMWQKDYHEEKRKERIDEKKNKKSTKNGSEAKPKETKDKDSDGEEETTDELPLGAVVNLTGFKDNSKIKRESIKAKIEEYGTAVVFIDFNIGDQSAWVRLDQKDAAKELAKKVAEEGEKLKIGEEELSLRVLEGEEEEKYHQKVKEQMLKRRNQNPKHRKGGRRGGRKMGRGGRKRGGSPASRNDSKKARRD